MCSISKSFHPFEKWSYGKLSKELQNGINIQIGQAVLEILKTWGRFSHWHGIRIIMCLPFGALFRKIRCTNRGVFIRDKGAQISKLGVFWAYYSKKHPILTKLGAFLLKMVYWWVGNLGKNWYRESQIFEVRQAYPCMILKRVPPPGLKTARLPKFRYLFEIPRQDALRYIFYFSKSVDN